MEITFSLVLFLQCFLTSMEDSASSWWTNFLILSFQTSPALDKFLFFWFEFNYFCNITGWQNVFFHYETHVGVCFNNLCWGVKSIFRFDTESEITTFLHTGDRGNILFIATDQYKSGNILFSNQSAIRTTDGFSTSIIAGNNQRGYVEGVGSNATFNYIPSFLQLSATHVLIADQVNHCLRSLDRDNKLTVKYVGNCTFPGNRDGTNALLEYPRMLINDQKNPGDTIIAERGGILKSMTTINRNVSYFGTVAGHVRVFSIIQEHRTGNLFMSMTYAVGIFRYQTKSFAVIAGTTTVGGFHDGLFSEVLFNWPVTVKFLDSHTLLVSDRYNNRLRVLDLNTNTSYSICNGENRHADGNFSSCSLYRPYGLTILEDTIYVGTNQRIRVIEGMCMYVDCLDPRAWVSKLCVATHVPVALHYIALNSGKVKMWPHYDVHVVSEMK